MRKVRELNLDVAGCQKKLDKMYVLCCGMCPVVLNLAIPVASELVERAGEDSESVISRATKHREDERPRSRFAADARGQVSRLPPAIRQPDRRPPGSQPSTVTGTFETSPARSRRKFGSTFTEAFASPGSLDDRLILRVDDDAGLPDQRYDDIVGDAAGAVREIAAHLSLAIDDRVANEVASQFDLDANGRRTEQLRGSLAEAWRRSFAATECRAVRPAQLIALESYSAREHRDWSSVLSAAEVETLQPWYAMVD